MTDWRHLIFQANDLSIRITECMPALIGYHAIFECSAYATTRQTFSDPFPSHISTVSQFLNQPDHNRLANFDLDQDVAPEHSLF